VGVKSCAPEHRTWGYPERTTDHGLATGKLYHLQLRVECTLFCNLQSRARTHAVLVIYPELGILHQIHDDYRTEMGCVGTWLINLHSKRIELVYLHDKVSPISTPGKFS
jgi:hypothetical protein